MYVRMTRRPGWRPAVAAGALIRPGWLAWTAVAALMLAGCSLDGLLKSDKLPPEVTDPVITQTAQGAIAVYNGMLAQFRAAFGGASSFVPATGLLSDELGAVPEIGSSLSLLDRRLLPQGDNSSAPYLLLNRSRALAGQAIELVTRYVPEQPALAGHAYAIEGYAEVFLAELFCSGIPLSTVDFTGDYTYQPGSTTEQVLTHARVLFDSALILAGADARVTHLAAVGKARALLELDSMAAAAAAVAAVPDAYRYEVSFTAATGANAQNFAAVNGGTSWAFTVADREGSRGLDYRTSGDLRTAVTARGTYQVGAAIYSIYHPNKYSDSTVTPFTLTGANPMVVASGVEARLIEAEAALKANPADGQWLAKLNALRTDGTQDGGGVYHPGTGQVAGLAPLADPSSPAGRVDLLFRERAFWLFLTGHRQGDLRRLIRQYGRMQEQVYPGGTYPNSLSGELYGSDVTAPIPVEERTSNPNFTGCISREA